MTDKGRQPFDDSLYSYDFDSEWDVEKALREPQTPYQTRTEQKREHREEYHRIPLYAEQEEDYRRPRSKSGNKYQGRKRKPAAKSNIRGWLILIGLGLIALLILVAFIWLIVAAVSPDTSEPEKETVSMVETAQTEENEVALSAAAQLVNRADAVAAGYDYDAAIDVLREFGADWENQPELAAARDRYLEEKDSLVFWEDTASIPHLAFHSLIVDTDRAFRSENADGYNRNMVTVSEFRAILEELYNKGYVLVRLHDVARYGVTEEGDEMYIPGNIYLPEGKTPLVISQDDVNYYDYMVDGDGDGYPDGAGAGFASRIVIDGNGYPTCEYYNTAGECVTGEYDLVPILEAFIREHPDFSYKGARAVLSITGYQGVFGYHTSMEWEAVLGQEEYSKEIRAAQNVAKCLKENGWEIASHGYGHYSYSTMTLEEIASDIKKWENQVQPIVGDSDIMMFPYGCDIENEDYYSGDEFDLLYDAGYRYFCSFNSAGKWVQFDDDYFRMSRIPVTGETICYNSDNLTALFDTSLIFDRTRPAIISSVGQ